MRILINVQGLKAVVLESPHPITAGTVGVKAEFIFDSAWAGLIKNAVIRGSGEERVVLNINGEFTVPWECMTEKGSKLEIGVEGRNSNDTVVMPTVFAYIGKIHEGVDDSVESATPPTPTQLTQLQDTINGVNTAVQQNSLDIADNTYAIGQHDTAITALNSAKHTHINKAILDGINIAKVTQWDIGYRDTHTHNNKSVLDGITAQKVAQWDAGGGAVSSVNGQTGTVVLTATDVNAVSNTAESDIESNTIARHTHSNFDSIECITDDDVDNWDTVVDKLSKDPLDWNFTNEQQTYAQIALGILPAEGVGF